MTIKTGLVAVACLLLSQSFAQQTRKAIDEAMTAKTMAADTSKKAAGKVAVHLPWRWRNKTARTG
ncbi:hypothetical protein [Phnomibacter ginsenosidimutans]|uniref:Uncharacterized protein n=1 Tax=Phnomibacter ginsenosidimutans TaxID=2676868 RepID=A0A6I6H4J1_9BACT|nr:hypothetical protein [Phnomibacter ginsenosidimutans]QGW29341.1 hypothetical protein GLV81_15550 [Phnomibacter ginsenosidimutans]